jgi:hypothetical protein
MTERLSPERPSRPESRAALIAGFQNMHDPDWLGRDPHYERDPRYLIESHQFHPDATRDLHSSGDSSDNADLFHQLKSLPRKHGRVVFLNADLTQAAPSELGEIEGIFQVLRERYRRVAEEEPILLPAVRTEAIVPLTLRFKFNRLAMQWRRETAGLSSLQDIYHNAAYEKIMAMGPDAVPLILEALRDRPERWFWALAAITEEDPAVGTIRFSEARDAWLAWGVQRGILQSES